MKKGSNLSLVFVALVILATYFFFTLSGWRSWLVGLFFLAWAVNILRGHNYF